jgi:hypothetical protein
MADLVTSQTIFSGPGKAIFAFTNVSDGTGESAVQKIDISALSGNPPHVRINKAWFNIYGMAVKVIFDHATDATSLVLQGDGEFNFSSFGGMTDPTTTDDTGDIFFTTVGHTSGDTYSIVMEIVW